MFCCSPGLFPSRMIIVCLSLVSLITGITILAERSLAQKNSDEAPPAFSDFKGVKIGTPADEARKKLGSPREKADDQDFYMFNDSQAVQVYYDKSKNVSAISIDFMSGAMPTCKEILGAEEKPGPNGGVYKIIRYPKAGFWVSYSRTAGDSPTVTITMQKLER